MIKIEDTAELSGSPGGLRIVYLLGKHSYGYEVLGR